MHETDSLSLEGIRKDWIKVVLCIFIASTLIMIYSQVKSFDFVSFDDPIYVKGNTFIHHGFSIDGFNRAFKGIYYWMWHPLTWISHMMDIQLFGMDPGKHHLTSVMLHILNSILLFLLFECMTGHIWKSFAVAALFALHPIHVESVAWVSERKDVLSTLFLFLTMLFYYRYVKLRTLWSYFLVVMTYGLGLMAKPMLVTLPFVLLLLDFWPLRRDELFINTDSSQVTRVLSFSSVVASKSVFKLVLEKTPLIIMAFILSVVTYFAQSSGDVVISLERINLATRLQNVITAYVVYLCKMLWPMHLAVYYPYPLHFNIPIVTACFLFLLFVTIGVIMVAKKIHYLATGWFWYIGTLVPVIGIVQTGTQAMADRYSYVPLVGIFVIVVWGLYDILGRTWISKVILGTVLIFVLGFLAWRSWFQVGTWKNSETLFSHAVAVTKDNYVAHSSLGVALYEKGDVEGAIKEYRESLRIMPTYVNAHCNIGVALAKKELYTEAFNHYQKCLQIKHGYSEARYNMGVALSDMGKKNDAIEQYREVLKSCPKHEKANNNLGELLEEKGDFEGAIFHYYKAIEIDPHNVKFRLNLVDILLVLHRHDDAAIQVNHALTDEPLNPYVHTYIGDIYSEKRDTTHAIEAYMRALSISPELPKAHLGLNKIINSSH